MKFILIILWSLNGTPATTTAGFGNEMLCRKALDKISKVEPINPWHIVHSDCYRTE